MKIELIGMNQNTRTAGPGTRLEYFTKGCIRGVVNPCQGCFNADTWSFGGQKRETTAHELIKHAVDNAHNGLITFCGGEPMIQAKALTRAAKGIKRRMKNAHIIMYTAYDMNTLMRHGLNFTWKKEYGLDMKRALNSYANAILPNIDAGEVRYEILSPYDVRELMKYVDIIVDGDYQMKKRLTNSDTMHDGWFIGSANQRVIDAKSSLFFKELVFDTAEQYNAKMKKNHSCQYCGKPNTSATPFCSNACKFHNQKFVDTIEVV